MIAPQRKRQKQEKQFNAALKKGDRVVTISGMHGKVLDLNEDGTCILETSAGRIKFDRASISMEKSKRLSASTRKKITIVFLKKAAPFGRLFLILIVLTRTYSLPQFLL